MAQAIMTATLTIIGGIVVFIVSNMTLKLVIEPINELKKTLSEIQFALVYYGPQIGNLEMIGSREAADDIRRLAAELWAKVQSIPCYDYLSKRSFPFGKLPQKQSCRLAAGQLIGLANAVLGARGNIECREIRIRHLLELEEID